MRSKRIYAHCSDTDNYYTRSGGFGLPCRKFRQGYLKSIRYVKGKVRGDYYA